MGKWTQPQQQQIKLPARAHVPLVRCRVQLLGRAAPSDDPDGIVAMQKPLFELYESYSPVESVLTAYTSGLVVRTPANADDAEELWFPIQDLVECGAMRPIGNPVVTSFAPMSEARKSRHGIAVFAFVFKRQDIPVSDCWAAECQSDDAAMALMTACMLAHKNPAGWASAVDRPPSTAVNKTSERAARGPPREEWDGAAAKEEAVWNSKFPRDYYEKPPLQGFYYTPTPGLIQQYEISELGQDNDEDDVVSQNDNGSVVGMVNVGARQPYLSPGDAGSECDMCGLPRQAERDPPPVVYPESVDMYRFPTGTMGSFIPESVVYRDDKSDSSSSDSDGRHGKDRHRKKKKSKKSKKKKDKRSQYQHCAAGGDMNHMIVPEEVEMIRHGPPGMGHEAFDHHLPHHVDHYVAQQYDPAWHYGLKSYIRDQQHVDGYTDPVTTRHRPYESHIDEFPPADYDHHHQHHEEDPYNDNGPYERRLPVAAGGRAVDPKMMNNNFILRQSDDYRPHL